LSAEAEHEAAILLAIRESARGVFAYFEGYLVIDARQAPAAFHLGTALWLIEPGERALDFFRLAVEGRPREFEYRSRYGQALNQIGRYSEAVNEFQSASELRPADAENWRRLGLALYRTGDRDGALQAYSRAMKLDPANQEARSDIGVILGKLGQTRGESAATVTIRSMLVPDWNATRGGERQEAAVDPSNGSVPLHYNPHVAYKQQDQTEERNGHGSVAARPERGSETVQYAVAPGG
jgi:tetratricopeptide (TPR) repeat protein